MRQLTSKDAQAAVTAAALQARKLKIRVSVAAVDADGTLLAFVRMDGSLRHLADAAIKKACVAASVGMSTGKWDELLLTDSSLLADYAARARMTVFAGGVPIHHRQKVVGAIGVAGGVPDQDADCARVAIEAIGMSADT
jgi:glc operon protein GlcG